MSSNAKTVTVTSVSITRWKPGDHVFYFRKHSDEEKENNLLTLIILNVNSLSSRHHYVNSARVQVLSLLYRIFIRLNSPRNQTKKVVLYKSV